MAFLDPLDEEETADYSDWRSIPDPPAAALSDNPAPTPATAADDPAVDDGETPEGNEPEPEAGEDAPTEGSRRPRKRPPAFRDVTNRQDGGRDKKRAATANHDSAEAADPSAATHDPSAASAVPIAADPFAFSEVPLEAANHSAAAAAELWGGNGGEARRRKRRRQRRSLVLPPELSPPLEEGGGATDGPAELSIAVGGGKGADGISGVDKETLLQLVRAYTALPPDRRAASSASAQIEARAAYPLPGKRRPVMGHSASREEFLRRVQPIVTEMERRKKLDADEARAATHCEVRKNGRAGYFYYDVESGERVGAEEYATRYGDMVAGRRRERIDRLGKEGGKGESSAGDATDAEEPHGHEGSVEAKPSAKSDGSSMDMDESVNMDESRMSLDESAVREEEETHASVERASTLVPSVEEARESANDACGDDAGHRGETHASYNNGPEPLERSQSAPGAHPLLAGMPPSDDPRVAAARERLRRAMDAALADYSREILAIEAADRAQLKQV